MATTETYALPNFIADVDRIAREETDAQVITERVAPLLARLVRNPDAIPSQYRRRPAGQRGRYMLHRAPHFNITSVIWAPGDRAGAHNHDTWGACSPATKSTPCTTPPPATPSKSTSTVKTSPASRA